eukprot:1050037-Amphidinium_carterae.1
MFRIDSCYGIRASLQHEMLGACECLSLHTETERQDESRIPNPACSCFGAFGTGSFVQKEVHQRQAGKFGGAVAKEREREREQHSSVTSVVLKLLCTSFGLTVEKGTRSKQYLL